MRFVLVNNPDGPLNDTLVELELGRSVEDVTGLQWLPGELLRLVKEPSTATLYVTQQMFNGSRYIGYSRSREEACRLAAPPPKVKRIPSGERIALISRVTPTSPRVNVFHTLIEVDKAFAKKVYLRQELYRQATAADADTSGLVFQDDTLHIVLTRNGYDDPPLKPTFYDRLREKERELLEWDDETVVLAPYFDDFEDTTVAAGDCQMYCDETGFWWACVFESCEWSTATFTYEVLHQLL